MTVAISAIVQSIIFCLIIGLPLPQFFSSRDVESLQFQQLPEQKSAQPPVEALENPAPAPTAAPIAHEPMKPKPRRAKHVAQDTAMAKPEPQPQQPVAASQTKVVVVNFEKSKSEDKKEEVAEQKAPTPAPEEKPQLVPVTEKLAGVQAEKEDAKTEATAAAAEVPAEPNPATAAESTEKAEPAN